MQSVWYVVSSILTAHRESLTKQKSTLKENNYYIVMIMTRSWLVKSAYWIWTEMTSAFCNSFHQRMPSIKSEFESWLGHSGILN